MTGSPMSQQNEVLQRDDTKPAHIAETFKGGSIRLQEVTKTF
jgi:hypothetical protein